MAIVSNTTVISNFSSSGRIDLLRNLFKTLYITSQVYDEIQAGLLQGYAFYHDIHSMIHPFSHDGWLHLTSLENASELQTFGAFLSNLHTGEASCLSVALHRDWTFLSDDKAARKAAAKSGVAISGTLGVLLSCVKRHFITLDDANAAIQKMMENGYYSPTDSLDDILDGSS